MKKLVIGIVFSGIVFLLGAFVTTEKYSIDGEMSVRGALLELGAYETPNHTTVAASEGANAEKGKEIVTKGRTTNKRGARTSRISKHFVCTSCHNIEREDPDLSKINPQARLQYTDQMGLPFLQGSPLYGIVNRETFYNDDYEKKYGDLVYAARDDLRQAIQLCSVECSQGRPMKEWELESVLMYLWTLELKMSDLNIDKEEQEIIAEALEKETSQEDAAERIKSKFLVKSAAHFISPPVEQMARKQSSGDPENGELIYNNSCMHCHDNRRYSFFNLDYSKATFKNLRNNLDDYHERSIYQVARYGTSPAAGKRAYMPQYTREKMSEEMLEDLKSYIIQEAN